MAINSIIWLQRDFRLEDNEAINYAAINNHNVIFVYIFDKDKDIGSASKWFLHNAIKSFSDNIKTKYNATLIIKDGDYYEELYKISIKYSINYILFNNFYNPVMNSVYINIHNRFQTQGIAVKRFNSSLLFHPDTIKNLSGEYFKVFTPFWKKCLSRINDITRPKCGPQTLRLINVHNTEENELNSLNLTPKKPNWAKNWQNIYIISEKAAMSILINFLDIKVRNYKEGRNIPSECNTSRLSPYLHFGLISPRQVYQCCKDLQWHDNQDLNTFISELGWREFSYYLLHHFPGLSTMNFKEKFNNFPWINDANHFTLWCKGLTGFPIVDAGMRELWNTGWMHNRVRMIVASFLTKNLLIDWRLGADWFYDCLVDADLAANSASWQWVAGSGVDAAPYFRIFNPITQSEKFDPRGDYIRKWVPELYNLNNKEIHRPINRLKYPEEIVDLSHSRDRALSTYKGL